MSAQIETLLDSYAKAANQNKSKSTSQQTNSNTASSFSNLLKEKLTGTVSLNRLEKQLAIPDTTKPADQDLNVQDQRPADRTDRDQERDPVEAAAAPARYEDNSQPRAQEKSAAPRDAGTEKAAAPHRKTVKPDRMPPGRVIRTAPRIMMEPLQVIRPKPPNRLRQLEIMQRMC